MLNVAGHGAIKQLLILLMDLPDQEFRQGTVPNTTVKAIVRKLQDCWNRVHALFTDPHVELSMLVAG